MSGFIRFHAFIVCLLVSVCCSIAQAGCRSGDVGMGLFIGEIQGPASLDENTSVQFSVVADGDFNITYNWTCDPVDSGTWANGDSSNATFNAGLVESDKPVTIRVMVNSANGFPQTGSLEITIVNVNTNQLVVGDIAGPDAVDENSSAQYSITASGDTGITYLWSCDPASAGACTNQTSATATFNAGPVDTDTEAKIKVTVNSDLGVPINKEFSITVKDVPIPNPIIDGFTTDRTTAKAPEKIFITINAHDPGGNALTYSFQATLGDFSGQTDNTVYWTPPETVTGPQTITAKVDNGTGEASVQFSLWSTDLSIVEGSTGGIIPEGTLESFFPAGEIDMRTDFKGKVLYTNYWATWCPYCVAEMPELNDLYGSYKNNTDYAHILLDLAEDGSAITNFVNSNSYQATNWVLDPGEFFNVYRYFNGGSTGIPQHALFDRDGNCRWSHLGKITSSSMTDLESAIDQLL